MEVNPAVARTYIPETMDHSFISCCPSPGTQTHKLPLFNSVKEPWVIQKQQEGTEKVGKANSSKSRATPSTAKVNTHGGQQGWDSGGRTPPTQHFEQKLSSNWRHRAANLTHTQNRDVGKNKTKTAPMRKPGREHIETIRALKPCLTPMLPSDLS